MPFEAQRVAERTNFVGLGFEVPMALVCKHEVEDREAALDEVDFVSPAVAHVLALDRR